MGLTRRSQFGFQPPPAMPSTTTTRLIPMTVGVDETRPWPAGAPGSAQSMSNYLPVDGALIPRSRLSSINTISASAVYCGQGMARLSHGIATQIGALWLSGRTAHAIISSTGSISVGSFVSAFGLGTAPSGSFADWNYARAFFGTLTSDGGYGLVAATPSYDTLLALYQANGQTGAPRYSYLTSAPAAAAVTAFDNYIVAWNIDPQSGPFFGNRVQWCVRGEPSNWTGEGSGFEDLLDMNGVGTAVRSTADGRILLFTDEEIWYGVRVPYPGQFQFFPLDPKIGCVYPRTIADMDEGHLFIGTDWHLRLLPRGGSQSQIVAPAVQETLRRRIGAGFDTMWAVYNEVLGLYYVFVEDDTAASVNGVVVNIRTGECGYIGYASSSFIPTAGISMGAPGESIFAGNEGLMFSTDARVMSTNSLLSADSGLGSGAAVNSVWRSEVLAADLPGSYKQLTEVMVDYRATSRSTLTLKISTDGGNNYETTGQSVSLASAPAAGRALSQVYVGGAFPTLEITSNSTGYELHRLDVTMNLGGRR